MHKAILLSCIIGAPSLHIESGIGAAKDSQIPALVGPLAPWRMPRMAQKSDTEFFYPRKETINLDLPPDQRWLSIMAKYRDELIPFFKDWQRILNLHFEIQQDKWFGSFWEHLHEDYQQELRSIHQVVNDPAISLTAVGLFGMMYELGSPMGCSEVLAAAPDGTVLHGRNLDYREISPTIETTFLKHGKIVFVSPMFLGGVGLHTGIKPGVWSFGQNTRFSFDDNPIVNYVRLTKGAKPYPFFVRDLMTRDDVSYPEALRELQDVELVRAGYFIIAGPEPYQGAVLSRSATPNFRHTDYLGQKGKWYLFQTNDDAFSFPLDFRRSMGTASMMKMSQDAVSPDSVRKMMMTPPVYASSNVILFMMSPKSGDYCSILGPMIPVSHDDHSIDCPMSYWQMNVTAARQAKAAEEQAAIAN